MKVNHIIESTIENVNLLNELAEIILDHLPDIKKEDEFILPGYAFSEKIKPIYKNYENTKYKNGIIKTISADYRISNKSEYMFKTQAYYGAIKNTIGINIAGILNNVFDIPKEKIKNNKKIKSVLIHELRHLFQYSEYPDFYKKDVSVDVSDLKDTKPEEISNEIIKRKKEKYRKMKVEIDAAWTHLLKQFDDEGYDVNKFVKRVMDELQYYRDLTPSEITHYKRKTARYYFDKRNDLL